MSQPLFYDILFWLQQLLQRLSYDKTYRGGWRSDDN